MPKTNVKTDGKENIHNFTLKNVFYPQYEEPRRKRPVVIRDERSADEITEDDLNMVAEFVSEKKYDSIYVSTIHRPPSGTFNLVAIL